MSERPRQEPSPWLFLGLFAAAVGLLYRPLFLGQAQLDRDVVRWILPARTVLREALDHHRLPLWNPWQGIGFPLFSDPLYGPFYPPTLLTLRGPLVLSTMLFMLAHVLSGGVGAFFLARRLRASLPASLIAALAWAFSGYISAEWITGIRLLSSSYFPWSALAWLYLAEGSRENAPRSWLRAPIAALPSALTFLTGEIFMAMTLAGFGLAVSFGELDFKNRPALKRHALASLLALFVSALSGAVSVLPAAAIAATTDRAHPLSGRMANDLALVPARIIELFAPGCLGYAYMFHPDAVTRYVGPDMMNYSVYLGAAPLALALCAPFSKRLPRVFAGLAVFLVLLSLGASTPVLPLFRVLVRPFAYMRAPEKFLAGVVPLVAALSAMGATRLLEPGALPWRRLVAFAALLVAYAALAPVLYTRIIALFISPNCLRSACVVLVILALARLARTRPRVAVGLFALAVFVDSGQHAWYFPRYSPSAAATQPAAALRATREQQIARAPAPLRVFRSESVNRADPGYSPSRDRLFTVDTLMDNTSVMSGVAILPGYDAAMPSVLQRVLASGRRDALRLLAVDYAVLAAPTPDPDAPRPGLTRVDAPFARVRVYRVERSLPRAFLAGSARQLSLRDQEAHLLDADVVDGRVAWVSVASPVGDAEPAALTPCILERYEPGAITARCFASRPSLAVFVEQYAPGWSASVDGRDAQVLQANRLLLGVPVRAGLHRITLRYRAPGLYAGMTLSLLAWGAILASLAALWMRRRAAARA